MADFMRSNWFKAVGVAVALFALAGCQDLKPPTAPAEPTTGSVVTSGNYVAPPMKFKEVPRGPEGRPTRAVITRIYWSGDGKWLVTTSQDGTVTIWDPNEEQPTPPAILGRHSFRGQWASMGRYIAVKGDTLVEDTAGKLTVRKISTGEALRTLDQSEHARTDTPFFLSDDAKRLVVLDVPRQEFNIWNVDTGKLIHSKSP